MPVQPAGGIVPPARSDQHHFHAGDLDAVQTVEEGLQAPLLTRPRQGADWQTDSQTKTVAPTLFSWLAAHARSPRRRAH